MGSLEIFRDHLLTLLPSSPAGVTMNCETCKEDIDCYNLFCRICNFIICTTCMVKATQFLEETHRGQKFIATAEGKMCLQNKHSVVEVMVSKSYPMGCTICDERLAGKVVSCMSCHDIYHPRCIELGRQEQFRHPLHADHILEIKLISGSKCSSCKLNITKYGICCSLCKVSFHVECSKAVDVSEDIRSSHRHTFYNYWIEDWQLARTCNVCSRLCGTSFYGCIDCNFSAHVECLGFPENVKNKLHQHTVELSYSFRNELESCSLCGTRCYNRVYHCQHCEDVFHMKCLMSTDDNEAATQEEQLRDIYLMYIERGLLDMLGKNENDDHRYYYRNNIHSGEEENGEEDSDSS